MFGLSTFGDRRGYGSSNALKSEESKELGCKGDEPKDRAIVYSSRANPKDN